MAAGSMPCSTTDGPQYEEEPCGLLAEPDYDDLRQAEIDDSIGSMSDVTGWSSDYYDLPGDAKGVQDLIEYREMNFAVGNIFKAAYRLGHKSNTTPIYDLDKIIWFATREKARQEKCNEAIRSHHDGPSDEDD
jgi:hypothetical protein